MKPVGKLIWIVVSLVAAGALAVVVGIVHPSEKVNALWLVTAAACFYAISYRFYSAFLAAKVLALDERRRTPALRLNDGLDYDPTNKWVLFGHHFAAIAGAGPLIGPMLAAQFGYLPGFLWILIGAALAGAVHDMVILTASVRRNGSSLAQIAKDEIGPVGGLAASLAIIFIIIVALAGLGVAVVNALKQNPWGTFTIGLTIPIALLMGCYLRFWRVGKVAEVSLIGVTLLVLAVVGGGHIRGFGWAQYLMLTDHQLVWALAIYGFIASVLPVWMLLAPRDYLSTYMKIGTIGLLAIGVLWMAPALQMPAITKFAAGGGPIIPGQLFPFMFITIACGAISGFHALIASGTTPKMIMSEKQIRLIGYGAMVTEGFVAVMALIAASILIPGDYFAINTKLSADAIAALGYPVDKIKELSSLVGIDVQGRPGGAVSLAVGMSTILVNLPLPGIDMKALMPYWYTFALMFEALFILTTIDAGTRVARFLIQELGGHVYRPLGQLRWLPGMIGTSVLVVVAWGYLLYTGNIGSIWPMFGIANQLLAAIALGVGTTVIIKAGKARYAWVTWVPMLFMYVTTFVAAYQQINIFRGKAAAAAKTAADALAAQAAVAGADAQTLAAKAASKDVFNANLDAILVGGMAILAVVALADMLYKWYGYLSGRRPMTTSEVIDYTPAESANH